MNALDKLTSRYLLADKLGGNTLIEKRRSLAAPHRGIRLASPETVSQVQGAIIQSAGMSFLETIHQEIEAAKPKPDVDLDKYDNSPYSPEA